MGLPDHSAEIVQHTLEIVPNLVIPVADNAKTFSLEICRPARVAFVITMLPAVDLNYQPQLAAKEVADEGADRHLTRELPSIEPTSGEVAP